MIDEQQIDVFNNGFHLVFKTAIKIMNYYKNLKKKTDFPEFLYCFIYLYEILLS